MHRAAHMLDHVPSSLHPQRQRLRVRMGKGQYMWASCCVLHHSGNISLP